MSPKSLMDVPSKAQVSEARLTIAHCEEELNMLSCQIAAEESKVAKLLKEAHERLTALRAKKTTNQKKIENARAILSPIRSMPPELLGNVFIYAFEADPLVAWRLAAVCSAWRRQALSTCLIWTRLHVKTNAHTDPELFRLWLERAGNTLPLDIDITLFDPTPRNRTPRTPKRRRANEGISFAPPSPGLPDINSPPPFTTSIIPPFPIGATNLLFSPPPENTANPNGPVIAPPPLPQFNPPSFPPLPGLPGGPPPGTFTAFSVNGPGLGSLLSSLASLNPGGAVATMMANWASNGDGIPGIGLPPPPPPPFPSMFDGPPSPITELPIDSGNDSDEDGVDSHLPMPMPMPLPMRPSSILIRPAHLRAAQSWGHIVLHYLHAVMPRWKRFVLQFENVTSALPGWTALESLNSKAPMLEEFAVVCSDARGAVTPWITDWSWLPTNLKTNMAPKLRTLELRNMPFAWNAPMLTNLTTLRLGQPLPLSSNSTMRRGQQMTIITLGLDRLLNLLQRNPKLENLEIHVTLSDALLPLEPTELPYLTSLAISGGRNALKLLEQVKLPALQVLDIHITARGDMDDVLTRLYVRSANPPVRDFRYVAGQRTSWGSNFAGSGPFPVTFLDNISDTIKRLVAVRCTLQTLLSELADAREGAVLCPVLKQLCLFDCHSQHNFVQQLIRLVETRNPAGSANSGVPARLNTLNLRGGPDLDSDVVDWLKTRVADVQYVDSKSPQP
ncbi:hypothetical protein B0J17DRAFT_640529 [Rhizoctonia solani]|nr:hypothetical protein B0J17DRAFT_640529 [Rhizoctonia solani]